MFFQFQLRMGELQLTSFSLAIQEGRARVRQVFFPFQFRAGDRAASQLIVFILYLALVFSVGRRRQCLLRLENKLIVAGEPLSTDIATKAVLLLLGGAWNFPATAVLRVSFPQWKLMHICTLVVMRVASPRRI